MSYFRHSSSRNEENSEKEPRKKTETLVRTNWGEIEMAKCEAGWLAGWVGEGKRRNVSRRGILISIMAERGVEEEKGKRSTKR